MPLPENFNINSFDSDDLWQVTQILAKKASGLHVARVLDPKYDERNMPYLRALLRTPEADNCQIEFEQADFRGTTEEVMRLKQQVVLAMGEPNEFEEAVWDAAPRTTPNPEFQHEAARIFLPYVARMSLLRIVRRESDNSLVRIDVGGQTTLQATEATPQSIKVHAEINLHLASLASEDLAPYQAITARAASWSPIDSLPPSLNWLGPLPPESPEG